MILFRIILFMGISLFASTQEDSDERFLKQVLRPCGTDQCECDVVSRSFEDIKVIDVQCPFHKSNVSARTKSDPNDIRYKHYRPQITDEIKFSCCRLPLEKPLVTYIEKDEMKIILELHIDSRGANQNITIEAQHFKGLEHLWNFKLEGLEDEFSGLSVNIFDGMKKLQKLKIKAPSIHLPIGIFDKLEDLSTLDLSGNKLKELEPGLLWKLRDLNLLHLEQNSLHSLSKDTFKGLISVEKLYLEANRLKTLDADVFQHLISLAALDLSRNNFSSFPDGLFSKSEKLKQIQIIQNQGAIRTLPKNFLANLESLRTVAIECGLQEIPETTFFNSPAIFNISLQNNKLKSLPEKLLTNQSKLRELNLSGNKITQIDDPFFIGLTSLGILYLSRNRFTNIPAMLFGLPKLNQLYLDNNQITSEMWLGFGKLSFEEATPNDSPRTLIVDLSNNSITDFSTENLKFPDSQYLSLNLTNNRINKINYQPVNFHLWVYFNNNPFECDYDNILSFLMLYWDPYDIKVGNLKCAGPTTLEGKKVMDLKHSNLKFPLKRNQTSSICPENCECIANARNKSLVTKCGENANFDRFPDISNRGIIHSELNIKDINLKTLPNRTSGWYNKVTSLLASGNKISEIGVENIPPFIRTLELNQNKLSTLNQSVINFFINSTLEKLKLAENPWNCGCENLQFMSSILANRNHIFDFDEMKCADGRPFKELKIENICSRVTTVAIFVSYVSAFAALIGGFAALFYKFEKQIKIWLYSHNLCLWFVTEEELDKDKLYDAFISYSQKDSELVAEQILPKLESMNYKICVHERDWMPGVDISTQISNSVNDAKRTIIVMSPNFLQSNWATWEFRVAQSHAATEKRSRIIVILFGDIGDINKLEPDLRDYLKLNTYVEWGDKWFWEKLKYAMPHCKIGNPKISENIKSIELTSIDNNM